MKRIPKQDESYRLEGEQQREAHQVEFVSWEKCPR